MSRTILAIFLVLLFAIPARAQQSDDVLNKLINAPSPKSWKATGLPQWPEEIQDAGVTGGLALRFSVPQQGAKPWSYSADVAILKPVQAGDVVLVAFWAKAAVPLEGQATASIPAIQLQENKAPYTTIAHEAVTVTDKWTMYYASGVADKDYKAGALKLTALIGAGKQAIDFGPVFVLNFGPNYDRSKLPHNKPVAVAAAAAAAPPPASVGPAPVSNAEGEQRFATELAKIRSALPVKGALINNPLVSTVGTYGPDQHNEIVTAADIPGGQALRVHIDKAQPTSFAAGTSSPLTGAVRKGDTLYVAFYAKTVEDGNNALLGVISSIRAQMNLAPWSAAVETSVTVPKNTWKLFTFSGVAQADLPPGTGMLSAQLSAAKQVLDFGPAFVLNLGPGVQPSTLPKN